MRKGQRAHLRRFEWIAAGKRQAILQIATAGAGGRQRSRPADHRAGRIRPRRPGDAIHRGARGKLGGSAHRQGGRHRRLRPVDNLAGVLDAGGVFALRWILSSAHPVDQEWIG